MPLLNQRAKELVAEYNRNPSCAKRYNPAAETVYQARYRFGDPLLPEFEPYIITGLKRFDMGRTMPMDFPSRLRSSLQAVRMRPLIGKFQEFRLSSVDLSAYGSEIESVYECFARAGTLHPENQSHVAATKILHWLFPDLFLMLPSLQKHVPSPKKFSENPLCDVAEPSERRRHTCGTALEFSMLCGGPVRVIAAIQEPETTQIILNYLGLPSRPPPITPARVERCSHSDDFAS
jgi:hypothetical protein